MVPWRQWGGGGGSLCGLYGDGGEVYFFTSGAVICVSSTVSGLN